MGELGFGRCGEERGEELLFEDGEGAVEVFEVQGSRFEVRGGWFKRRGELAEAGGGFGGGGAGGWGERGGGGVERGGVAGEVVGDAAGFEAGVAWFGGGCCADSNAGFLRLFHGFEDGLRAPCEAVDLALAAAAEARALCVVFVEGGVDAAEHGCERDAGLAPGFDQGPVERGEHKNGAAALLEAVLDLGEVVEVVHKDSCELSVLSCQLKSKGSSTGQPPTIIR